MSKTEARRGAHFLAVKSNLGMRNRQLERGSGLGKANVALGADKLLAWAKEIMPSAQGEMIGGDELWQPTGILRSDILDLDYINQVYSRVVAEIEAKSKDGETVVVLGGDHSVALPAAVAAQKKIKAKSEGHSFDPEKFGLLMFDSHADLHQPETSPSDNFHGMWLRVLSDEFNHVGLNSLAQEKIKPENIMLVGDHSYDFESAEADFIKKSGIQVLDLADYYQSPTSFITKINDFIEQFEDLHLTFDLDFIASDQVAVNIANPQGFTRENWEKILPELRVPARMSISFVELNPLLPEAEAKVEGSRQVFAQFINHFLA